MIKIGIIGLGYWGPNLVRNFYHHEFAKVDYVCDLNQDRLKKVLKNYSNIRGTVDYADILKSSVDLVVIATPPEMHYQMTKKALEAGKNVLVEKPFTLSSKDAVELIDMAEKYKLKIFVDHTFVFHPVVRKIKEIIKNGELGDILYFDSERINLGLLQSATNVVWDLAVHDFSILVYLFDNFEIKSFDIFATRHVHNSYEDIAHVVLNIENNITAHVHVSWLSPVKIRKTIIGGSKRMLWWDDVHPFEKLKIYDSNIVIKQLEGNPFFPTYITGDVRIIKVDNKESLALEVDSVLKSISGNTHPEVGGYEGLKVVELLEKCDLLLRK